jgi:hypothetical protein
MPSARSPVVENRNRPRQMKEQNDDQEKHAQEARCPATVLSRRDAHTSGDQDKTREERPEGAPREPGGRNQRARHEIYVRELLNAKSPDGKGEGEPAGLVQIAHWPSESALVNEFNNTMRST